MTRYRVLSWRDIPLQLKIRDENGRTTAVELDRWYTEHADRVAMALGMYGSESYLDAFEWSPWRDHPGSPAQVAADVVDELDETWAPRRDQWRRTGGLGV